MASNFTRPNRGLPLPLTKHNLVQLLFASGTDNVIIDGVEGIVSAIEREDGSGRNFNVTLYTANGMKTICIRTLD